MTTAHEVTAQAEASDSEQALLNAAGHRNELED